jgi:hypothetical protein
MQAAATFLPQVAESMSAKDFIFRNNNTEFGSLARDWRLNGWAEATNINRKKLLSGPDFVNISP